MNNSQEQNFEDIKRGDEKRIQMIVTESKVNEFARISGDYNSLHMDELYAKKTDFKKRICHGMLLASFFSQLVGMHIPGKNALYLTQSLKFISPCFIGDKITVYGKVLDKSSATKVITLKTSIINYLGNEIVDGEAKVIVR